VLESCADRLAGAFGVRLGIAESDTESDAERGSAEVRHTSGTVLHAESFTAALAIALAAKLSLAGAAELDISHAGAAELDISHAGAEELDISHAGAEELDISNAFTRSNAYAALKLDWPGEILPGEDARKPPSVAVFCCVPGMIEN
jgi:hypothetical protein